MPGATGRQGARLERRCGGLGGCGNVDGVEAGV